MQPRVAETKMRNCLNTTLKYQNNLWTKITLERLLASKTATFDILKFAYSKYKRNKSLKYVTKIIASNIDLLVCDANERLSRAKKSMMKSKIELTKVVKQNTLIREKFDRLVDKEWNANWNKRSKECEKKVKGLKNKFIVMFGQNKNAKPLWNVKYKDADLLNHTCDNDNLLSAKQKVISQSDELSIANSDSTTVKQNQNKTLSIVNKKNESENNVRNAAKLSSLSNTNKEAENLKSVKENDLVSNKKIINLGVENVDTDMRSILEKPPGYAVFRRVRESSVEVAIEESFAKMRYDDISKESMQDKCSEHEQNGYFNENKNELDFTKMRTTDMKRNKRVFLPEPSNIELQTKRQNLKYALMDTVRNFNSDFGDSDQYNLNDSEKIGLQKLQKCIRNNELIVNSTDKSKRLSVNKPENYREDMKVHYENDQVVDQKFVNKTVKCFNETCKSLASIVDMGSGTNQTQRIMNNVVMSSECEIPVLGGMYKDHKKGRKF